MYTFDIAQGTKADLYRDLIAAVDAITSGEPDAVANLANVAALIWEHVPGLNWAGFYRMVDSELVLGPFQGKAFLLLGVISWRPLFSMAMRFRHRAKSSDTP